MTQDGRLAVIVETRDAWSTNPRFSIAGSAGTLTLTLGLAENNLLGTGTLLSVAYVKFPERDGVDFATQIPRVGKSRVSLGGQFQDLSDGNNGNWNLGVPYRDYPDHWGAQLLGNAADERALQFRRVGSVLDTTTYQHSLFSSQLNAGVAALHSTQRFLRVGLSAIVRTEEYVLQGNTLPVSDSTFGAGALTVDYSRSAFTTTQFYQGFGQDEDIDLSLAFNAAIWLAPAGLGYASSGVGPLLRVNVGARTGVGVLVGTLQANGLFNESGLDSGRVVFQGTWASKLTARQMVFLHAEAGILDNPAPGQEFNLGLIYGPRTFGANAFVGTRQVWGTLEYRNYKWDAVFGFLGVGFAGFVDYGGAWYGDQDPNLGGNVGVGLRLGSAIGSKASAGRIDVGYRWGNNFSGKRLGISFGASYNIFTGSIPSLN
jgi:hypothetical protein